MFFFKLGGRCGCVYGTKGAADRKLLGTADIENPVHILTVINVNVRGTLRDVTQIVQSQFCILKTAQSPTYLSVTKQHT
jgi:hypothetical protein